MASPTETESLEGDEGAVGRIAIVPYEEEGCFLRDVEDAVPYEKPKV